MYRQNLRKRGRLQRDEKRVDRLVMCGLKGSIEVFHYAGWIRKARWEKKEGKTDPDRDQSFTSPSPPPVAKLTASSLAPTVANGCQAAPPTLSVCPLFVEMGLRFGRSQSFVSPVQDVVRMYWEDGEKRMVDKGRSSPNWEPKLLNDCHMVARFDQQIVP